MEEEEINNLKDVLYLVTTNADANFVNQNKLEELDGERFVTYATILGDVAKSYYMNQESLEFKIGSQIMMLTNSEYWKHRTMGKLLYVDPIEDVALVLIDGEEYEVKEKTWKIRKPSYDK